MRWLLIILVALATAVPAFADSWMPPSPTTYVSADKAVRLIVEPRELQSLLAYFEDKAKGREPAGQRAGETKRTARGVLERRVAGRWTRVWEAPLANEVAPVSAIVSNGGEHVVTFDNWHSMGWGDNVVVIYDGAGKLVRALRLDQIVPAEYIKALPSSVSSLWWGGEHRFSPDGRHLALAIVIPNDDKLPSDRHATVEVEVDLNTGVVVPPSGAAWDRALTQAKQVARERDAAEAAQKSAFVAPLSAPTTTGEREWHDYMREAFFRLDRDWKGSFPSTTVLRAPTARDYKPSETWVREALDGTDGSDVVMLTAPAAPDRLVAIVQDVARGLPAGKLKDVRVYLAIPATPAAVIRTALMASGAEIVVLDLTTPIPQRPERLRGATPFSDETAVADTATAALTAAPDAGTAASEKSGEADDLAALADALEQQAEAAERDASKPVAPKPRQSRSASCPHTNGYLVTGS